MTRAGGTLLVENGTFLTLDEARPVIRGNLVARDGVIEAVGPDARAPDADDVVDATGCVVTPGLVNAHTHSAMTLFRGFADDLPLERWLRERVWPAEAHLDASAVRAGSALAVLEMLASGTTAFNDMYFFADETAAVAESAGMRAAVAAVFLDFPTPEMPPEKMAGYAVGFLDRWRGRGLVTPSLAAHGAYTCGGETLDAVAAIRAEHAQDGVTPLFHTHCSETLAEVQDVLAKHGTRPLAAFDAHGLVDARSVLAHCGWITKDEVRRIAAAGAAVAHCPASNMKLATGGWLPVPELLDAGATVAIGTDGAASNNTLDVLESAKFAALGQKQHRWDAQAFPAGRVLAAATRDGARALGLENVGIVAPGWRADLAVFDFRRPGLAPMHDPVSQLVYAARGTDVRATIVDGRVLYRDGAFVTMDAARVVRDAEAESARVTSALAT